MNRIDGCIRENAVKLIREKKIEPMIAEIGELFYTGSYALDLMTWNDIDIQIALKKDLDPVEELGKIFLHFSKDPDIIETQMIHFKGDHKPTKPRGVYLGVQLNSPSCGGLWKIDFWVLQKSDIEENRQMIESYQAKLSPEARRLIIEMKAEMMKETGRVPPRGSYMLCQAILVEGLRDKMKIMRYLADAGVKLGV